MKNIKTIITTIAGILACAAMEFLLLMLFVKPTWLDGIMSMVGIVMAGLLIGAILVFAGYFFGRISEHKKADIYISKLVKKHSDELKKQADEAAANHAADSAKSEHFWQLRDEQHIAEISRLNELITKMSEDMSHLGMQLPHNQESLTIAQEDDEEAEAVTVSEEDDTAEA